MSVRNGLLALLAAEPAHGYALKSLFEEQTAGAWPLNVGQVYTTLSRLERDGLVEAEWDEEDESDQSRYDWRITRQGRVALEKWYTAPIDTQSLRDELAIKVLLGVASETVDVSRIIRRQRGATMKRLQEYTQQKRETDLEADLPWVMLLDAMILKAEAEIKWLDLCDERLRGRKRRSR